MPPDLAFCLINPQWFELPTSRTNFHDHKDNSILCIIRGKFEQLVEIAIVAWHITDRWHITYELACITQYEQLGKMSVLSAVSSNVNRLSLGFKWLNVIFQNEKKKKLKRK